MKIQYEYEMYYDLLEPHGALTLDKRCHACWTYTRKAMKARELHNGGIDNQIIQYKVGSSISEMPHWHESRDEEIARSTAIIYGLESPDEFLKEDFKKRCWTQAQMLGLNVNIEIYNVRPGVRRLQ